MPRSRPGKKASRAEVEQYKFERRYDLLESLLGPAAFIVCILASALPIWVFLEGLHPFVGRTTSVSFNLVFSATLAMSVVMNIGQAVRGGFRRREMRRLRDRTSKLEKRVADMPAGDDD